MATVSLWAKARTGQRKTQSAMALLNGGSNWALREMKEIEGVEVEKEASLAEQSAHRTGHRAGLRVRQRPPE